MNNTLILITVFYIIPAIIVWIYTRNECKSKMIDADLSSIFYTLCPIINFFLSIVATGIIIVDIFKYKGDKIAKRFFLLK